MSPDATLTDPVCGMTVRPDGPHRLEHDGTTYGFCSAGCLAKFRADADRYLDPSPAPESATPARAYTCPMHPEIVLVGQAAHRFESHATDRAAARRVANDFRMHRAGVRARGRRR